MSKNSTSKRNSKIHIYGEDQGSSEGEEDDDDFDDEEIEYKLSKMSSRPDTKLDQ